MWLFMFSKSLFVLSQAGGNVCLKIVRKLCSKINTRKIKIKWTPHKIIYPHKRSHELWTIWRTQFFYILFIFYDEPNLVSSNERLYSNTVYKNTDTVYNYTSTTQIYTLGSLAMVLLGTRWVVSASYIPRFQKWTNNNPPLSIALKLKQEPPKLCKPCWYPM